MRLPVLKRNAGFTLLEILVVLSILGILVTLAIPSYQLATLKAKEATLKEDLFVFRDLLDQYYSDHGSYPSALEDLVEMGYLRAIPVDPMTQSKETWIEIFLEEAEGDEQGVYDVHSGSNLVGTDGTPYNEW
jgi:general secretion pathway protein G